MDDASRVVVRLAAVVRVVNNAGRFIGRNAITIDEHSRTCVIPHVVMVPGRDICEGARSLNTFPRGRVGARPHRARDVRQRRWQGAIGLDVPPPPTILVDNESAPPPRRASRSRTARTTRSSASGRIFLARRSTAGDTGRRRVRLSRWTPQLCTSTSDVS
jgi:hypothetical protein